MSLKAGGGNLGTTFSTLTYSVMMAVFGRGWWTVKGVCGGACRSKVLRNRKHATEIQGPAFTLAAFCGIARPQSRQRVSSSPFRYVYISLNLRNASCTSSASLRGSRPHTQFPYLRSSLNRSSVTSPLPWMILCLNPISLASTLDYPCSALVSVLDNEDTHRKSMSYAVALQRPTVAPLYTLFSDQERCCSVYKSEQPFRAFGRKKI
jgi:hypothetical protein